MKKVCAYIQPLALGDPLPNQKDIPVTLSQYQSFGRKNIAPDNMHVYVINVLKYVKVWRTGNAA